MQLRIDGGTEKTNAGYEAFVEKFKPKKTTDDCYTPPNIYDAVATWVENEYHVERSKFVRPFYPGGNYERFSYPAGSIVVDNPPFSILVQIVRFYEHRDIKYFLFAPTLTLFSARTKACAVAAGCAITYANGANVNTSFLTNLETCAARSAPTLYAAVAKAETENIRAMHAQLPKYEYPPQVLTATRLGYMSRYGIEYAVPREKCKFIRALDAQRPQGKGIYGGGYLLSSEAAKANAAAQAAAAQAAAAQAAAAQAAAAQAAAAQVWKLSDHEKFICDELDKMV